MSAYRFLTDCYTGLRHWHYYIKVGKPLHNLIYPCSKAAIVGLPLAIPYSVSKPYIEQTFTPLSFEVQGGFGEAWAPVAGVGLPWAGVPFGAAVAKPTGEFAPGPLAYGPAIPPETPPLTGPGAPLALQEVPEPPSIIIMYIGIMIMVGYSLLNKKGKVK